MLEQEEKKLVAQFQKSRNDIIYNVKKKSWFSFIDCWPYFRGAEVQGLLFIAPAQGNTKLLVNLVLVSENDLS